ncbi:peptidylprolyl isomerase [Crocosphaera sp. UHCC 0190]|uniref:peptidylprolyl isomerase n=1 Tax=Crocosphaera sp. UHCC 0190 TaxID=3110246 RepID=UPI002B214BB9|nr:peptidylprolyl isomerase [Crocosphaera sp. UHCC 0190]MEA5511713.1 peptidylprolyl isomerase [Crocosphaera sp. UHCC 0190]
MGNFRPHWLKTVLCVVLISGLLLTGCSNASNESNTQVSLTETKQGSQVNMDNYVPRLEGNATVEMIIKGSPVTIEVEGKDAPITAGNFVDLVERGVYNGLVFHRVVTDPQPFVAQGGDPKGNGTGGFIDPKTKQERRIPLEIKLEGAEKPTYSQALGRQGSAVSQPVVLKHQRGAVAMARSGMPDSASSQFYFALSDLEFLDGDYAVFGKVTQGMDVVDSIKEGDRIESAKVTSGLENLKK